MSWVNLSVLRLRDGDGWVELFCFRRVVNINNDSQNIVWFWGWTVQTIDSDFSDLDYSSTDSDESVFE